MATVKQRVYLVISSDQSVRAAKRPRIGPDEVAIAIDLTFPNQWGNVIGRLEAEVPDFAPSAFEVVDTEPQDSPD